MNNHHAVNNKEDSHHQATLYDLGNLWLNLHFPFSMQDEFLFSVMPQGP